MREKQNFCDLLAAAVSLAGAKSLVDRILSEKLHSRTFISKVDAVKERSTELERLQQGPGLE